MRAMFDRIAGVYDLMNSVMTAGLHHALAPARRRPRRRRPGRPRARRRDRHRRPGASSSRGASGPSGEVVGVGLLRGDARARAREGAGARRRAFEWGNALELPYADDEFDAATVGFGARNFSDLERGLARDGPRRATRRAGGRPRDHDADAAAAVDVLRAVVRPRRAGARRGSPATRTPTATCRAPSSASPARASWPRTMDALRAADVRYVLTAGGIIALARAATRAREPAPPRRATRRGVAAIVQAGGPHVPRAARGAWRSASPRSPRAHGPVLAEHAGATIAAGGKRLRPLLVLLAAGAAATAEQAARARRRGRRARPLARRSSTTTCSTPRALRRGRPTVVAHGGPRLATATGDLLFSRAFSELAAQRRPDAGAGAVATPSSALARGELLQRADAWNAGVAVERYLRAAS